MLDHTKTVELTARLKLISEASNDVTNRAGLGIALTDDQNLYSEFYINANEVFLNKRENNARVRDSSFTMNTTAAFHDYTLQLQGSTVRVFVDGVLRLTGSTFNAADIAAPTLANTAAFGDITSQAASTWQMTSMSVSVFVPEPSVLGALGMVTFLSTRRRVR